MYSSGQREQQECRSKVNAGPGPGWNWMRRMRIVARRKGPSGTHIPEVCRQKAMDFVPCLERLTQARKHTHIHIRTVTQHRKGRAPWPWRGRNLCARKWQSSKMESSCFAVSDRCRCTAPSVGLGTCDEDVPLADGRLFPARSHSIPQSTAIVVGRWSSSAFPAPARAETKALDKQRSHNPLY